MFLEILGILGNYPIIVLILLTLLPFLELRASIPYGILSTDLHWALVFLICVVTNIVLGPVVYIIVDKFIHIFLRVKQIDRLWNKLVERAQHKISKAVNKWGDIGVALFIGVPLPGSGSYSGALGSYVIGLGFRKFIYANLVGVIIAGIAVTAISLSGLEILGFMIKRL